MKRVEVAIPFHNKENKKDQVVGDVLEVSEERLAEIRAINVNMVLVLGDVEEPLQESEVPEIPEIPEAPTEELKEEPKEVKKPKTTKKTTKTTK